MTPLRQRMLGDMQLRGLSERTQETYIRAVRQLAEHYDVSPDHLTEEEVRQYLLFLHTTRRLSRASCTIALCAIKFFYERTLQRLWAILDIVRPVKGQVSSDTNFLPPYSLTGESYPAEQHRWSACPAASAVSSFTALNAHQATLHGVGAVPLPRALRPPTIGHRTS